MSKTTWDYGGAYEDINIDDIKSGYQFKCGSKVKVHNIFEPLPKFMKEADLLFVDPPWNLGNINTFYTKAEMDERVENFEVFYKRLFECIKEIKANVVYIEIGKEYLAEFILELKQQYKYVTFYNSTYYHNKDRLCYVIRASNKFKKPKLDGMDEEDIISWICENEEYDCIGDLCMGRGLVALNAYRNNKKFVGTELNFKRLSVPIKIINTFDPEELKSKKLSKIISKVGEL